MIFEVFSIYDEKADAYLPPFILPNIAMAKRVFGDCINSADHQFGQHPSDYTLFRLGQFDDMAGQYLLERAKQSLGNGVEFVVDTDEQPAKEGRSNGQNPRISEVSTRPSVLPSSAGENPTE